MQHSVVSDQVVNVLILVDRDRESLQYVGLTLVSGAKLRIV